LFDHFPRTHAETITAFRHWVAHCLLVQAWWLPGAPPRQAGPMEVEDAGVAPGDAADGEQGEQDSSETTALSGGEGEVSSALAASQAPGDEAGADMAD
jgi:hypothetical protein